uniref:Uncharacterized protein n=1 Tax=Opuntia streptacantha TaxID=393608 RepID=A0A7C9DMY1_OPUST
MAMSSPKAAAWPSLFSFGPTWAVLHCNASFFVNRFCCQFSLHAEIEEFKNGGIQDLAIGFLGQQLNLLNDMNSPAILQIGRVHVLNRRFNAFSLLLPSRSEILFESPDRPPPQLPRPFPFSLSSYSHGPLRRREQTVPVGVDVAAVGEPENHRRQGFIFWMLPQHPLRLKPGQTPPLLVL